MRRVIVAAIALASSAPASAQSLQQFTIDSVIDVDAFRGDNISHHPQVVADISAGVRIGDDWQVIIRPWIRQPRPTSPTGPTPPMDVFLYQAGARFQRNGPISTRLELGQIVSPVGLGLFDARPNINPTIMQHATYFSPMPAFDPTVPRVVPVSSTYPLGAQLTLSGGKWDARGALVNSAPSRAWDIGNGNSPHATPVVEGGAGFTPHIGLRLGASFAHGEYATGDEVTPRAPNGRQMTLVGGEAEYEVRFTRIAGEFVSTRFQTSSHDVVAYEWFVQGIQTLTPRWFVAGRHEGASAPPLVTSLTATRATLTALEATLGFRLSHEFTLRGSYYGRTRYNAPSRDDQAGVSLVWQHRWW